MRGSESNVTKQCSCFRILGKTFLGGEKSFWVIDSIRHRIVKLGL